MCRNYLFWDRTRTKWPTDANIEPKKFTAASEQNWAHNSSGLSQQPSDLEMPCSLVLKVCRLQYVYTTSTKSNLLWCEADKKTKTIAFYNSDGDGLYVQKFPYTTTLRQIRIFKAQSWFNESWDNIFKLRDLRPYLAKVFCTLGK